MIEKNTYNLENIPDELRSIFTNSLEELNNANELISMVEFSFVSMNVFSLDFEDPERNKKSLDANQLLYELFSDDRKYVDRELAKLPKSLQTSRLHGLYSQTIVYFWTNLESFVKRLINSLIKFDENLLAAVQFNKIQIPMADFYSLDQNDRAEYLTNLIIEKHVCSNKLGVYKLECYLEPFGLSGSFDKKLAKNLVSIHQLRNCIVHNDSVVDSRLVKACGWMKYTIGDNIHLTRNQMLEYGKSALHYQGLVFYRINKMLGAPAKTLQQIQKIIDSYDKNP